MARKRFLELNFWRWQFTFVGSVEGIWISLVYIPGVYPVYYAIQFQWIGDLVYRMFADKPKDWLDHTHNT